MNTQIKARESGIELLRILAAAGVVFSHYCNEGGIFSDSIGGGNYLILSLIRSFTISSVDIFVLITGYFLCATNKRSIGKPLGLLLQVVFYALVIYVVLMLCGVESFSVKHLVGKLVPANWFITLYVVLFLISPYINVVINNFTEKDWKVFLITVLTFFSICPMILGVTESFGYPLDSLSTIGHTGNAAGYSLINFITLYCVGAYIRLCDITEKVSAKVTIIIATACAIILWLMRMIPINSTPWHIAGWYDNIFCIVLAASLFITFKKIQISNGIINAVAKAALSVYIIHYSLFVLVNPVKTLQLPVYLTLLHILLFIIFTFVVALVLFHLYNLLFKRLIKILDKHNIPYFEK